MPSEWAPSDPKLSSALRAAAGASYGALVGAALAAAITIALAPSVVVPALLTIMSSGAGALLGLHFPPHGRAHVAPGDQIIYLTLAHLRGVVGQRAKVGDVKCQNCAPAVPRRPRPAQGTWPLQ